MEAPGQDPSRNTDKVESPAWHGDVLREREQRVEEGKKVYVDWEAAKRDLRKARKK